MLNSTVISLVAGVVFSQHATNCVRPLEYASGSQENLSTITLYFTRLVLGVQLVLAGVQLPSKYLLRERKSLALLLGPGMTFMWLSSSLVIWGLVPNLDFLHALAVGACVTPTDPVLSSSIVKGKFADKNIPKHLQSIIIAESGANDGLGYPFLFFALYLIKYLGSGGAGQPGGVTLAIDDWFGEIWGYTILLSVVYGATVGWGAKELLQRAQEKNFVDRESFLLFAITLALFIVGTCGMIGTDDVLACFIAGNAFNIDDWFRLETLDDSLQPTIDMLLNLSIFMWFGAVCPWGSFLRNDVIPIYRLVLLGILILLFRRLPVVLALHTFQWSKVWQIEQTQQALFVGFFGPIGVSAIFYLYVSLESLHRITVDGEIRADAKRLEDVFTVVIWFLVICSIVRSNPTIPLRYIPLNVSKGCAWTQRSIWEIRLLLTSNAFKCDCIEIHQGEPRRDASSSGVEHSSAIRRTAHESASVCKKSYLSLSSAIIQPTTSVNGVGLQTIDAAKERASYGTESLEWNNSSYSVTVNAGSWFLGLSME